MCLFLPIGLLPHYLKKNSWVLNSKQARSEKALCSAVCRPEVLEEKKRKKSRSKDTDSAVYSELIVMVEQSKNLERMQEARKQLQITVDV